MKTWLNAKLDPFWRFVGQFPSWFVELISGILCASLARIVTSNPALQFAIATGLSLVYERFLDRNGFSWSDVEERTAGIMVGVIAWCLL